MQTQFARSHLRRVAVTAAAVCLALPIAALAQEYPVPRSEQATPDATVKQAQPQVTVEQEKPNVTVQQTGKPQAETATPQPTGVAALGRRELIGKTIYGQRGEAIVEIDDVVAVNDEIQAVLVDVGGFLGFGAKTVAIALTDLELRGGRIVAPKLTEESLEAMPAYSGIR
jgi:hypothetical protein